MDVKEFRNRAAFVGHLRVFTDIPYAQQIMKETNVETIIGENPAIIKKSFLAEAPRFEARFKGVSHLINKYGTKHIIELASGFSTRGLLMTSDPGVQYIETDLAPTITEKQKIVNRLLFSENITRSNLQFIDADVLKFGDLEKVANMLPEAITITHEGLFAYFNPVQIRAILISIHSILLSKGGTYITPDFTTREKRRQIRTDVTEVFSGKTTEDSIENNGFESEKEIFNLLDEIGFEVNTFSLLEVSGNLTSIKKLNLNSQEVDKLLENRWVYCMTIK